MPTAERNNDMSTAIGGKDNDDPKSKSRAIGEIVDSVIQ